MKNFAALIFVLVFGLIYIAPTIIAFRRHHPNRWLIAAVNCVGGMTGFLWIMTLIWSLRAAHLSPSGSDGGESGFNIAVNDEVRTQVARDKPAQLAQLQELLAAGSLTREEHAQLKAEIVNHA